MAVKTNYSNILTSSKNKTVNRYLLLFLFLFSLALVSGFFYFFLANSQYQLAMKTSLISHYISGLASLLVFLPYLLAHQRSSGEKAIFLILPWLALKRLGSESNMHYRQRLLGHLLNWAIIILGLSGVIISVPALLWLLGIVWLPEYLFFQVGNAIHLGFSFVAIAFIGLHAIRLKRNGAIK